jgi:aminopeptidase N
MSLYCRRTKKKFLDADRIFHVIQEGMKFYEKWFQTSFPFDKYDQIFVPEFNWGAMENVGAVVLRDEFLFEHEAFKTERFKRADTLVHELAHMWFGNLVTMKWWDDLWLNEAFATWAAYCCLEGTGLYPEAFCHFASDIKIPGIQEDMLSTTHPVIVEGADTEEAFLNFDAITYRKGASLLKQLGKMIGEESFAKGLKKYFSSFAFKNANLYDFLSCFQGLELEQWIMQWLKTTGVNLIQVEDCGKTLKISQHEGGQQAIREHRLSLGGFAPGKEKEQLSLKEVLLESKSIEVEKGEGELFYPNVGDFCYCRVSLDKGSLKSMGQKTFVFKRSIITTAVMLHPLGYGRDNNFKCRGIS